MTNIKKLAEKARRGDIHAQHALATSYAIGDGVGIDYEKARYWYQQAAIQDDADAAYNLGAMFLCGDGGRKCKKDALLWFRKAAALGSGDASIWLAEFSFSKASITSAYSFYADALVQGDLRGLRGIASLLAASSDPEVRKGARSIRRRLKKAGVFVRP